MSPRHGYRKTVFALFALLAAAVVVALPHSPLFSQGTRPDLSLAASLNKASPIPSPSNAPVSDPISQNDPQSAKNAEVTARDSYHAKVVRKAARRKRALAALAATPAPAVTPPPAVIPSPPPAPPQSGTPQQIAMGMLSAHGWPVTEFGCLLPLWNEESGWNPYAENAGSGAYGIPQALPGDKMASAGADWQTDATTQIIWGLGYIQSVYGTPCAAWAHETAYGWY